MQATEPILAFVGKPESVAMPLQIMLAIESILDRVATELQLPQERVRSLNMYQPGEKAVCGQAVEAGQA